MIVANQVKVGTLVRIKKHEFRVSRIFHQGHSITFYDKFGFESTVKSTDKITVLD